jgi:predicted esterase
MKRFATFLTIGTLLAFAPLTAQNRSVETAFEKFWAASSPAEGEKAAALVVKSGVTFEDALRRLKAGRTYTVQKSGIVLMGNKTKNGTEHNYAVNVPENYEPSRRYQVRFQLHGGVNGRRSNQPRGNGSIGALAGTNQFYVLPYAWNTSPWWGDDQVQNIDAIIDSLKRTYNIDENRIVLSGVSDGGTGVYYIGMRDTTPFASFLPLNGFIMVLGNPDIDDGAIYPNNLRNKPLFIVNGGRDPLYPTRAVEPYVKHLQRNGVEVEYHPQPEAAHNTSWWPEVKDIYEAFVTNHPRNPDPDKLTWETSSLTHNRAHWVVIDKLGRQPGDPKEPDDMNVLNDPDPRSEFSHPIDLFSRSRTPGIVDIERSGNTVNVTTKGVAEFTLLLSTDRFDFDQPIQVVVNGHEVHNARVPRNLETLMKWAARDNDRTMLYAAELKVRFGH